MAFNMARRVTEYEGNRKRRRAWHKALAGLACIVVFCTTYALILPAITMENKAYCGLEEHLHSEAAGCYERVLACGYDTEAQEPDGTPHVHTGECYELVLACELTEHEHTEECYAAPGEAGGTSYAAVMASLSKLYDEMLTYGAQAMDQEELTALCLVAYDHMSGLSDQAYSMAEITHEELEEVDARCEAILRYMMEEYGFDPYGTAALAIGVDTIKQSICQTLGSGGLEWLSGGEDSYAFDPFATSLWAETTGLQAYSGTLEALPEGQGKTDGAIWYTVEFDPVLGGSYREYHVYTADQLYTLLYYYGSNFAGKLKESGGANKLGIVLENDLDLGGADGREWPGYRNISVTLDLAGNGHTIYNGYFAEYSSAFLGTGTKTETSTSTTGDQRFIIHDVTFSAMYIGQSCGIFGRSVKYGYFYNVNFENCLAVGAGGTAVVLGYSYTMVYMKDCMVKNSHAIGSSHSGLFASYNGGHTYSDGTEMIGAGTEGEDYYYGAVPEDGEYQLGDTALTSLLAVEAAWNGAEVGLDGISYLLTSTGLPSIYEDCGTVDCGLYVITANANHSGGFVACSQGATIFRNCFSTTDCYCQTQCGVFIGAVIGSGNGFDYPDVCGREDCDCTGTGDCGCGDGCGCESSVITNIVFEDCWTSGSIEGSSRIGGFVGMIFDDVRALQDACRGHAVFKNCYSTSSVGMEFSGSYVGGFCGIIIGNVSAADEAGIPHVFKNCYAAGEVGGIATDTDKRSTENTIGGFFGMYVNSEAIAADINNTALAALMKSSSQGPVSGDDDNHAARLYNCCYDMQTTAMRERDVGASDTTYWSGKQALAGTLPGLTGVYTRKSDQKNVKGLTDTQKIMGPSDSWVYCDEYYPLTSGTLYYSHAETGAASIDDMYEDRAAVYHAYTLASAATVFLDHYDEILSDGTNVGTDGTLIPAGDTGKTGDATVYDTIRDITRKFTFTSNEKIGSVSGLTWQTSKERNENSGFAAKLGDGFSLTWDEDGESAGITAHYNPNVLTVYRDGGTWKCVDFAPGKQWVNVSIAGDGAAGTRYLRLLPSAYLNAGGILSVEVAVDKDQEVAGGENGAVTNSVNVYVPDAEQPGGWSYVHLDGFEHYVGVAYAVTDRTRQDSETNGGSIYKDQALALADPGITAPQTDETHFAFYSGYLRAGDSRAVGLGDDGSMLSQTFPYQYSGDEVNSTKNLSTSGSTIVRVYHATDESGGTGRPDGEGGTIITLTLGDEITDANTLKKFEGRASFEVADAGFYYMIYQWRLNDGRYLEDVKLVQVTSDAYTVTMVTGIKDGAHTVSAGGYTAIDQYVDLTGSKTYDTVTDSSALYPSGSAGYAEDYRSFYDGSGVQVGYDYNEAVPFAGSSYGVKSVTKVQTGLNTITGWKSDEDYRLVSVIMEANDGTGWAEVERINLSSDTDPDSFNQAVTGMEWKYTYTSYEAEQDPEYKTYTVVRFDDSTKYLTISGGARIEQDEGSAITQYYIELDFRQTTGDSGDDNSGAAAISSGQKNIRIVALYEQTTNPVAIYKVNQYGDPVDGAVFAAYAADGGYQYQTKEGGHIGLAGCTKVDSQADVKRGTYFVDPETGNITANVGGTPYEIEALYTGTTAGGIMVFMENGLYLDAEALRGSLGDHFILREIKVPDGHRAISEEIQMYISSNGLLMTEDSSASGASVKANARVTATQKLYYGIPLDDSGASWTYREVTYGNSAQEYYSFEDSNGEFSYSGTLFAVVLKKNGAEGWVDNWHPVYGNDAEGYTVSDSAGIEAVLEAVEAGGSVVFTPNSDMNIGVTGMEAYLTNLPGDITQYVTYLWETMDPGERTIDAVCEQAEYFVAYYYTTADRLEDADAENTVRVVSREGVVTAGAIDGLQSDYPGFDIAWGATISVTNYENRVYFQKENEAGAVVKGAAFALYRVGEDSSGRMYYLADGGARIYLAPDTDGINRGTATVNNAAGTYVISAGPYQEGPADGMIADQGYGKITVEAGGAAYTITPVQAGYTHVCDDLGGGLCTGHFTRLPEGMYAMREIYAPRPYALNTAEVQIYVDGQAVYVNAGTESDGVKAGKGPGYLAVSMQRLASLGDIDNTLSWIYTLLQVDDSPGFSGLLEAISADSWKYATPAGSAIYGLAGGGTTDSIAQAMVTYLEYDLGTGSSIFNYSATGVNGGTRGGTPRDAGWPEAEGAGQAARPGGSSFFAGLFGATAGTAAGEGSRRLYTETGWSRLAIYQDYLYGSAYIDRQEKAGKTTYTDMTGSGDISALFSRSTFIVVTDQIAVDLEIEKVGADSARNLAGAQFLLYYLDEEETPHYYVYDEANGLTRWTTDKGSASSLSTSDEEGGYAAIQIHGLTPRDYYLEETAAPDGYKPLTDRVKLSVEQSGEVSMSYNGCTYSGSGGHGGAAGWAVSETGDCLWTLTVPNSTGEELPETGGMGVGLLNLAGLALTLGAGTGLLACARKRGERAGET